MEKQNRFLFIICHDHEAKDQIEKKALKSFSSFSEATKFKKKLQNNPEVVIALLMDQATQKIETIKGSILKDMKEILSVAAPHWKEKKIEI